MPQVALQLLKNVNRERTLNFICTGLTPASWAKRGNAIAPGLILFHQEWGTGREMRATQRLRSLPMLAGIKLGTAVLEISIT